MDHAKFKWIPIKNIWGIVTDERTDGQGENKMSDPEGWTIRIKIVVSPLLIITKIFYFRFHLSQIILLYIFNEELNSPVNVQRSVAFPIEEQMPVYYPIKS